jgi:hypothetical protein
MLTSTHSVLTQLSIRDAILILTIGNVFVRRGRLPKADTSVLLLG